MSDDPTLADIDATLVRLRTQLASIAIVNEELRQRITALEARMVVLHGSMSAPYGDSAPGVITPAEPNAPR